MILICLIVVLLPLTACSQKGQAEPNPQPTLAMVHDNAGDTTAIENTFKVKNSVTVTDIPAGSKRVRIWLAYPQTDANQTISDFRVTKADGPFTIKKETENNNKFLYCEVSHTGQSSYTMEYEFTITRTRQTLNTPDGEIRPVSDSDRARMKHYLGTDSNITIDTKVRQLADTICGDEIHPVKQAKKIYDWCIDHGEYWKKDKSRYAPSGKGNTDYFLEQCTGNRTDFHAGFISLMRARGIPTRIWFGGVFWVSKQGNKEDISYHCWPEFYAPGHGWVVVDASQADFAPEKEQFYFGNLETRRIVFTQGRDINLAPKQQGEPLIYFAKAYAEVDGKPHEKWNRKLEYDLVK